MNTISLSTKRPFVSLYWDYFILSRLHSDVAMVLQRFEFWDGTKTYSAIHNEQLNEQLEQAGKPPTQETSRWFYKSQEELAWELMGITCEKKLSTRTTSEKSDPFRIFDFLIDELHYVEWRNNPDLPLDRKKQYRLNTELLQQHINYLNYIVDQFQLPLPRLAPIFYAIEQLTRDGVSIDTLSVALVIERLKEMQAAVCQIDQKRTAQAEHNKGLKRSEWDTAKHPYPYPLFVVNGLRRLNWSFLEQLNHCCRFRSFAEWKAQFCGIESADLPQGNRNSTACMPQSFACNSIGPITYDTPNETTIKKRELPASSSTFPAHDAAYTDIAARTHEFSSLLATIATLTHEQKQQLAQVLLGPSSPTPHETTGPSDPPAEHALTLPHLAHSAPDPTQQDEETDKHNIIPIVITTPAVAFPHDEEHDATTVSAASLGDEASTPAAHASEHGEPPKSAKTRKKKTIVSLTDATPVPTPEKPPADEPWTPLTCLKLADYYRGETLPESERKDSPYQKAVQAAISLVNRQRMTYEQVDAVFRYMKGIDASLKDDWWTDKKVDLWHVAEHCAVKLRERERKAKKTELVVSGPAPSSPERPSVLVSEEKRRRNLERLRALAEAKAPQEQERAATLAR